MKAICLSNELEEEEKEERQYSKTINANHFATASSAIGELDWSLFDLGIPVAVEQSPEANPINS